MSDLIDRAAAIDALERKKDKNAKGDVGGFYNKIIQNDIDALMQLPSAQPVEDARAMCGECDAWNQYKNYPQPGWIPVTEKLPEYGTTVLTCDHDGEYEINHIIDEEDGEWFWNEVVAWMPLPEPYQEEGEGDE